MSGGWTLVELVARVAQALAADGVHAPNGRVRDVPDARAIRWYATIGLVDRPSSGGRRGGRYGHRHLLQVVAVKRRQAAGRSLAEIQAELAGATDAALREVARVPEELLAASPAQPEPPAGPAQVADDRGRFWAVPVAPAGRIPAVGHAATPPARHDAIVPAGHDAAEPAVRYLVALAGGVTLALPAAPDASDLAAIRAAAEPLLDLLADHGLIATNDRTSMNEPGLTSMKEPENDHHAD